LKNHFFLIALLCPILVIGQSKHTTFQGAEKVQKGASTQKRIIIYLFDDSSEANSASEYLLTNQHRQLHFKDSVVTFIRSLSKGYIELNRFHKAKSDAAGSELSGELKKTSKPLLKVHGNILYDVNYNSRIDTPYAENDVYQHTIQTYLDITVKEQYPLRFYFTTRFSNSNLFRNLTDVNLQFNPQEFTNRIKEKLKNQFQQAYNLDSINALKGLLETKSKELSALRDWLKNPATTQRLIEERERQLYGQGNEDISDQFVNSDFLNGIIDKESKSIVIKNRFNKETLQKSIQNDSIKSTLQNFQADYDKNKMKVDSVQSELIKLRQEYMKGKEKINAAAKLSSSDIDAIKDIRGLQKKLSSAGIPDSLLPSGYKFMWSLRSFKAGRSIVDYSELSAKNISITGLQAEYNPYYYIAVASGIVDYRFRDFIVRSNNNSRQYLNLVRIGKGFKEGNNLIVTYYSGRRQLFNSSTTLQGQQIPNYKLMGFTLEGQFKISRTNFITGEVAKSSLPYYSLTNTDKNLLNSTFRMEDHSNEAYAVKLVSFIPSTQTKMNGYFRRYGANFQSFSLFTSGSAQNSWALRIDQPLFKRRLSLSGSVRANDFSNPFVSHEYRSTAIFKSIQATLRIKKYPVISVGYFPSSQLTKLNDGQYVENLFYTLTASANHFYHFKEVMYNTSAVYTQFYNKAIDSNFVYFNTKNLLISQNILLNRLSLQINFSGSANTDYKLYTLEYNVQYKFNNWLSTGAGIKYNKQTIYNRELLGSSGNLLLKIPKTGEFQFTMDNGFMPGSNKELVKNNFGRLTFFKIF